MSIFLIIFDAKIIKTFKTKSAKDISMLMWVIVLFNFICGLAYSIHIQSFPFVSKYILCLLALGVLIFQNIKYGKK